MFSNFDDNSQNDELLDEIRQKINEQSHLNFEEKKNEINRSKNAFIGAVSGIALSAVVGWFALSPRYDTDAAAELPVIRRPQTAIKVQPAEPGGMEILNQDKSVYDIIEKKDNTAPRVENLLPPPEEPKVQALEQEIEKTQAAAEAIVAANTETPKDTVTVAKAADPVAVKEPEVQEKTVSLTEAVKQEAKTVTAAQDQPKEAPKEATPEPKRKAVNIKIDAPKAEPVKEEAPKQVAQSTSSEAPKGSWQIQLMSSPNLNSVKNSWTQMTKKYPFLKELPHEIENADLGSKGMFYRLKTGAFKTRAEADKICGDIKALGGSCIVKKK